MTYDEKSSMFATIAAVRSPDVCRYGCSCHS